MIGGSVNGASTAFQLARRGMRVGLVEQGQLGFGATGTSGALVRCHYASLYEAALPLESTGEHWRALESTGEHWRALESTGEHPYLLESSGTWDEHVGVGDTIFQPTGFLRVVRPEDEIKLRANIAVLQELEVETELVAAEHAHEVEPLLRTDDLARIAFQPNRG